MLLCCDFEERMVLPFVLRAVTSFAEPEKSLNAMDGLTIIVFDLVKQPCDSDYKYSYILPINQMIDKYNLNNYFIQLIMNQPNQSETDLWKKQMNKGR